MIFISGLSFSLQIFGCQVMLVFLRSAQRWRPDAEFHSNGNGRGDATALPDSHACYNCDNIFSGKPRNVIVFVWQMDKLLCWNFRKFWIKSVFMINYFNLPRDQLHGPLLHGLTLIPAWISNRMPSRVWDEIICPFPNFSGCTVKVARLKFGDGWVISSHTL